MRWYVDKQRTPTIAGLAFPMGAYSRGMPQVQLHHYSYHLTNACGTYADSTLLTVVNCDSISRVAQTGSLANGVNVYPNPASGVFSMLVKTSGKYDQIKCSIANMIGEIVKEFTIAANKETQWKQLCHQECTLFQ